MCSAGQDIDVQIAKNFKAIDVSIPRLRKLVTAVCGRSSSYGKTNTKYEINIAIVDDVEIGKLAAH